MAHLLYSCLPCLSFHLSIESQLDLVQLTAIPHPPYRTISLIILLLSFPFIDLGESISYQSWILYPRLTHSHSRLRECVTGIFSLVMGDDFICDSCFLDKLDLRGKFCYKALALKYYLVTFHDSTQRHTNPPQHAERLEYYNRVN